MAFELHGSSVGLWSVFVPDTLYTEQGLIAGQDRPIRSDEWAVFTPMALSQYYNDFGLTSDILRATETDVYMVYGQPARDWSIIFRPFQAGYLFLSPARGLSFYWAGKLIALLLVSFEFGLLITGRNKGISLAYAFLTALAPVVQWWFSVNAFPDMLVYGQGIVLCVYHYMRSSSYARRAACALGFVWLGGAYHWVMGSYPIMYGAKTVNSTNTYMNGALWEKLDPEGEYTQVYNRYVHPVFSLSNTESTRAELLQDELMLVRLNTGDLQKIGVQYILSEYDISQYNGANAVFERIYDAPGVQYGIYRVLEGDPEE